MVIEIGLGSKPTALLETNHFSCIFTYMSNIMQCSLACALDEVSWGAALNMTYH